MKWRKFNRNIHRDLGYFFVGLTIIYSVSGIALNHLHHWNPDLKTEEYKGVLEQVYNFSDNRDEASQKAVSEIGVEYPVKSTSLQRNGNIKVFLDVGDNNTGSLVIDHDDNAYKVSILKKRVLLREMNLMHRNNLKQIWTWVSDIYALGLIILAITGMIILRGKFGFKRYGVWLVGAGIVIPIVIFIIYM